MSDVAVYADVLRRVAIDTTGMGLLAAVVAALVAGGYRWLTTRSPPAGTPVLCGCSAVAGSLSYTVLTDGAFLEGVSLDHQASAGYLLATVAVAGTAGAASGRLGDRIARLVSGRSRIDGEGEAISTVRSARLAVDLRLPETIADADGYRPVSTATRRALSGAVVRLPHGLSIAQRRERLECHLERAFDVGYANVTMAADGGVDRVLVGRRAAGLGSMLPPKTVGVAIRAEPPPNASLGDPVQIWSTPTRRDGADTGQLVATGTLRAASGTVATVLVDPDRAADLSADARYRLVVHPGQPTGSYEFAATIRTVDETVTTVTVAADGPLAGEFVGWLPGRVLVVDRDDELLALPDDNRTLEAGDELWILATPETLTAFDRDDADGASAGRGSRPERSQSR